MRGIFVVTLLALLPITGLQAQTPSRPNDQLVRLASMEQDMQILRKQVSQLQLEIENLRRENEAIKTGANGTPADSAQISALRAQMLAEDSRNRQEIVESVSKQIERLATQTQTAIQALAKSIDGAPKSNGTAATTQFSENYPKEGIAYTVQKGDTLSSIARKLGSTIKDIQNANKIASPKDLREGQNLFIPQANPSNP
ncbi:MAG: LysM peptidoglycan-binding domain-containing protein [Verrucomicrobiota bacterium]|nr:LysM peptidoglycan-binding domain-containing protein [Verrucomicrobiota bacterium]